MLQYLYIKYRIQIILKTCNVLKELNEFERLIQAVKQTGLMPTLCLIIQSSDILQTENKRCQKRDLLESLLIVKQAGLIK